jgi:hypothetical protein
MVMNLGKEKHLAEYARARQALCLLSKDADTYAPEKSSVTRARPVRFLPDCLQ